MGLTQPSRKKFIIIYGLENSGKTLLQYQSQATKNLTNKEASKSEFNPTIGINYEELALNNFLLGIFDVSGSLYQYNLVNIICKNIDISGIIFVISLSQLKDIKLAKEALERILGNNYLKPNQHLLIIYNKHTEDSLKDKENNWIDNELLDNKLEINKLKVKYQIKSITSQILDIKNIKLGEAPTSFIIFDKNLNT